MSDVLEYLTSELGEELAKDIIQHRKGIKCPLTLRGAKSLVKEYKLAGDPIAMAEHHLNMGWRGFSHTWIKANRNFRDEHNPAPIRQSANYGNAAPERPPEPKDEAMKERIRKMRDEALKGMRV